MDKQTIINFVLSALPALWGAVAAPVTVAITAFFNSVVKAYVPREVQIPLAGILGAVLATLGGGDPAVGAVEGASIQTALSLSPKKFLASGKE